jgi:hypothetical protein
MSDSWMVGRVSRVFLSSLTDMQLLLFGLFNEWMHWNQNCSFISCQLGVTFLHCKLKVTMPPLCLVCVGTRSDQCKSSHMWLMMLFVLPSLMLGDPAWTDRHLGLVTYWLLENNDLTLWHWPPHLCKKVSVVCHLKIIHCNYIRRIYIYGTKWITTCLPARPSHCQYPTSPPCVHGSITFLFHLYTCINVLQFMYHSLNFGS